jgi:prophage antirepressor-like protein
MENKLKIFENSNFGEIRTSVVNGIPVVSLPDIVRSLDLDSTAKVKSRLDESGIYQIKCMTGGGTQTVNFIDEPNIYRCIFQSKKPNAKKFQDWVFKEVLPSISHTGMYATEETIEKFLKDPDSIFKVIEKWKEDREGRLKAEGERDVLKLEVKKKDSKLEHYEMITKSEHLLTITEVSKFFGTGPVIFCRLMRALKFHRKFRNHYELIQKYSDKNYGKVVEVPVLDENGDPIMWNKQLNYTRAGKEYVAHWWEKIGLISKNGSKQFVFNREKAKEILGLSDEEMSKLEFEDNLI